jgi:hypothetical protein
MNGFKLLIDTNVVIGLEDALPVQASLAELVRVSGEHGIGLFVDGANYDDVARDKDETRRAVTLSKLAKFQQLRGIPLPAESVLVARFGAINNDNDRSDVRFLAALEADGAERGKAVRDANAKPNVVSVSTPLAFEGSDSVAHFEGHEDGL